MRLISPHVPSVTGLSHMHTFVTTLHMLSPVFSHMTCLVSPHHESECSYVQVSCSVQVYIDSSIDLGTGN